jgi:hypothetical protein
MVLASVDLPDPGLGENGEGGEREEKGEVPAIPTCHYDKFLVWRRESILELLREWARHLCLNIRVWEEE